ncbi:MAG: hypothetical protein QXM76_01950 [Zestosphaera sp.]
MDAVRLGVAIILTGFAVVFISMLMQIMAVPTQAGGTQASAAGCVVILFVPICFGLGSPDAVIPLITLTLLASLAFVIIGLIAFRRAAHNDQLQ